MKISCSECRQQLGELIDSALTGETAATADARAHVETCAECRRDLALLSAARNEMRAFPLVATPPDLRERIRAQLAAAPSTPAVAAPVMDRVRIEVRNSPVAHLPSGKRDFRSKWTKFFNFLERPPNVAWSSAAVLGVFCFVLLTRPGQENLLMLPPQTTIAQAPEYSGDERKAPISPASKSPASKSAPVKPKTLPKINPPQPAVPGQMPTAPSPILPGGLESDPNFAPPSEMGIPPTARETAPPIAFEKPAAKKSAPQPSATRSSGLASAPKPASPSQNDSADIRLRSREKENAPAPRSAPPQEVQRSIKARQNERIAANQNADSQNSSAQDASGGAGVMSAPAPTTRATKNADSARSYAMSAPENAPVARQVVARIVAPRDMNWGQLSIVLPDGVRFSDGDKARVLWRGAVSAGESVEVRFEVQVTSGTHAIRVSLQEVVKGEAKTLARDSVSVSGR